MSAQKVSMKIATLVASIALVGSVRVGRHPATDPARSMDCKDRKEPVPKPEQLYQVPAFCCCTDSTSL